MISTNKCFKIILFIFFLVILPTTLTLTDLARIKPPKPAPHPPPLELSIPVGEKINYDIKKLKLTIGQASIEFNGPVKKNNQDTFLISFSAKSLNFFDEEKIYLDSKTFYPLIVERNLDIWGKKEMITENYDLQKGVIKIIKNSAGKITEQTIAKKGPIDNIYGFIYRYRQKGQIKLGDKLKMSLPTKDVEFQVIDKEKMKAADREFEAYYMQSTSRDYQVWFENSPRMIPLKIDGAVKFIKASLIMNEYKK